MKGNKKMDIDEKMRKEEKKTILLIEGLIVGLLIALCIIIYCLFSI